MTTQTVQGAFRGFKVGSRLILTRDALPFAKEGVEVEVVEMTAPQGVAEDGIKVRKVDPDTGEMQGRTQEFIWGCGRRYFQ